ncbi:DUF4249 domain-containing protein [Pedobacter yulinensis]|uniref:DUF4249 domain-containing protein n=1 Tax=Pedobacter yulinensis TaxID=2126353 RepID=A0A2T3HP12_9SPHI|nr:DUF4249 domain-containing protein [Pedobacter yulinensis]PST84166.1 DUF4249 domain-containing protein [Pedobacter yulinensis]
MKTPSILFVLLAMGALVFQGCEKVIEVDVNNAEPQLVIEGAITDETTSQVVRLSKSVPYTEPSVFPAVRGATVRVTDNLGNTVLFPEAEPGVYRRLLRGQPGRSYKLDVQVEGKSYTATSVMPAKVQLDSLSIATETFFGEEQKELYVNFKDPAGATNYYHFRMFINGRQVQRPLPYNDRFTNGNSISERLFYRSDNIESIKTGDVVEVEMQCVDRQVYNYWFVLTQSSGRGPGGGTTPSNPDSNISGGALGYFSAHTAQRMVVTTP